MMRPSSRGSAGFTSVTGVGTSSTIEESTETVAFPENGRLPVSNS